jgi:ABC-type lipoprotein export system ATPase subunit
MIKLKGLQKYYNRKKTNEIHVINDITLDLPDTGLVVLLGPSGSGKTTLLNVLGGLDKVHQGSIMFGDEQIERYSSKVWDKIRNRKVGYIFQNYNLLTNLTVYDNISLTLNMVGIDDKEEIDKRIDYILDSMGMINYRKRRAFQLSGGQQQRVAIARALAKNPSVIIADEPTGNLDSKNTQDIMNIIKQISLNKLVVLVTHEEELAAFYGDRIIRLEDGKIISDISNSSNGSLDVQHETDIYLGDMRPVSNVLDDNSSLKVYTDEDIEDKLDIRLIVKNKTVYIDVKSKEYQKIQLLEKDTEIKIYDKKYEKLKAKDFVETDFNLESIITETQTESTKHSVISIKDSLKLAVRRLQGSSKLGKLFYVGFAGGAILIALAIGMLSGILTMEADEFLYGAKEMVVFDKNTMDYDDILLLADNPSVNYFQVIGIIDLNVDLPTIYQNYSNNVSLTEDAVYSDYLNKSKIIYGNTDGVQNYNEFVIDKRLADQMLMSSTYNYLGITTYKDLLDVNYSITLEGPEGPFQYELNLVAIVDDGSAVIYARQELIFMSQFKVGIYEVFEDDITLDRGFLIEEDDEFLIYDIETLESPLALNRVKYFDKYYHAVGAFTSDTDVPLILVKRDDIGKTYFDDVYVLPSANVYFHSNNIEETMRHLTEEDIESESTYLVQYEVYRSNRLSNSIGTIIFTFVVLAASAISYFFIIRSSLLSRIYEVSVYRALGVTKGDIRKIFTTEIILITTLTSIVGYLATTLVMYRIQVLAEDYMDLIYISPLSIVSGVIIIYTINIISGLIPVSNLLLKTPAEILSKYDF